MIEINNSNNLFSEKTIDLPPKKFTTDTISAQLGTRFGIISFAFCPLDSNGNPGTYKVYPVKFYPTSTNFKDWQVCLYNDESQPMKARLIGIETYVQ